MKYKYIQDNIEIYNTYFKEKQRYGTLVAVTKYQDFEITQACIDLGIKEIAESKVQEAEEKKTHLTGTYTYHMIGHLQSNKVKKAVACFDVIQSVDSLKILRLLQKETTIQKKHIDILLQINATQEPQKYGFLPEAINEAILLAKNHKFLHLKGCMCMGKSGDTVSTKEAFIFTKNICNKHQLPISSLGMTQDWKTAIEQGSTIIRIGSGLFNTSR